MQKPEKILFLTLKIFSATGGIEKVCKLAGLALYELQPGNIRIFSMHDSQKIIDEKYFPLSIFTGFGARKIQFIISSLKKGIKSKTVILSHINLLLPGYLIKILSPKTRLVLFAHGVECWKPLSGWRLRMLKRCDKILAVSSYTREKLITVNDINPLKCTVLNNSLDPFLPAVLNQSDFTELYAKYKLSEEDFILTTITRIAADEQYKGHEKVIQALSYTITEYSNLKYLIVGKYDSSEKERLDRVIQQYNLESKVIFTGFVPDADLPDHYKLADVFIMPSTGEGFGIVFIEAMYYGLPVIAGNKDGSADALLNGKLGLLVNPSDAKDIASAIEKIIFKKKEFIPDYTLLMEKFGFMAYKNNLKQELHII